jgi:hypothetical protein
MPQIPEPVIAQPVDISNTLAKIASMKHADMMNKNLQSEIATREANSPSLIAERESQNALRVIQTREAQQKEDSTEADETAKAVKFVVDNPNPDLAYNKVQQYYASKGHDLPSVDTFYTKGKNGATYFDTDMFEQYADSLANARKLVNDTSLTKKEDLTILNPKFDKTQPVSAENPKLIKQRFMSQGRGKVVPDTSVPWEPVVDPIAKENRAAKHQETLDKATVEKSKREAVKASKAKIGTNASGETVRVKSDGTIEAMNADGDWEAASAEQSKGIQFAPSASNKPKGALTQAIEAKKKSSEEAAKKGGDYKTAEDVRKDFKDGKIKKEDAVKILVEKFGIK